MGGYDGNVDRVERCFGKRRLTLCIRSFLKFLSVIVNILLQRKKVGIMYIRHEVLPFIGITVVVCVLLTLLSKQMGMTWMKAVAIYMALCLLFSGYFLYFFRDPKRHTPVEVGAVIAPADGVVAKITRMHEGEYLKTDVIRISIFLSLFDVHVNRAPISGLSKFLGYFPGKHFFTFEEKSSDYNQHNSILITGDKTRCLVNQIVGPVCRRVVYWPDHDKEVQLNAGDKIGMMKFGSRLDMYFPEKDIDVIIQEGERVKSGDTIIARIKEDGS